MIHALDLIAAIAVIGGAVYVLVLLVVLGLCKSAAEGDAAMLAYLADEHGFEPYDPDVADAESDGRAWIARLREAS